MSSMFNVRYRKVGGIRFLRLGRLQFSFCLCRPTPKVSEEQKVYAAFCVWAQGQPRAQPAPYIRHYEGGSTVVVYEDR